MYSYIQCVQCDPEAQELEWIWKDLINTLLCLLNLSVQVFSATAPMTFLVKVHWECTQFEYTINIDFSSLMAFILEGASLCLHEKNPADSPLKIQGLCVLPLCVALWYHSATEITHIQCVMFLSQHMVAISNAYSNSDWCMWWGVKPCVLIVNKASNEWLSLAWGQCYLLFQFSTETLS